MTSTGLWIIFLLFLLACVLSIAIELWLEKRNPGAVEKRARADMEAMLRRANEETAKRPRVRAGNPIY